VSLYLVRHAIAAERGEAWPDDRQRPLTADGIDRFRRAVAGLRRLGVRVDIVLTSPLVRARQTADLLATGLGGRSRVCDLEALAPGYRPRHVADAVLALEAEPRMALVGHEPGLGELAAFLIGARQPLAFKKGGVCRIDLPARSGRAGQLAWFATPRMLRGLAG
jgi:phosphohistidine phosphatase